MMAPRALYRLADALELTLRLTDGQVRGERMRSVELAGVPLPADVRVVSSALFGGKLPHPAPRMLPGGSAGTPSAYGQAAVLLLHGPGRLGLLASYREPDGLALALLDLDQVPDPEALFERECPTDQAAAEALLAPGVVASFTFKDGNWSTQPGSTAPQQAPFDPTP